MSDIVKKYFLGVGANPAGLGTVPHWGPGGGLESTDAYDLTEKIADL